MNTENPISLEIFKNISFKNEDIIYINNKFEKISLKKGDILLKPNTYNNNQYYVFSGCLRSFFVNTSGKEFTTQFAINDWWISDYNSFFIHEKSILSIECLQDAVVYKLTREDMNILCDSYPKIENFFRKKLESAFANFQKRISDYLSKTAKVRYVEFINRYPSIEENLKNYHIASYLGITTESLSRIRKILIKK